MYVHLSNLGNVWVVPQRAAKSLEAMPLMMQRRSGVSLVCFSFWLSTYFGAFCGIFMMVSLASICVCGNLENLMLLQLPIFGIILVLLKLSFHFQFGGRRDGIRSRCCYFSRFSNSAGSQPTPSDDTFAYRLACQLSRVNNASR